VILFLRRLYKWRFRTPRGLPRAVGHWLFGVLPEVMHAVNTKSLQDWFVRQHALHGKTLSVHLPFQPIIVNTIDPKNVEHALKTKFDNYIKGEWFRRRLTDLLGDGIFNIDGAAWHKQRKITSQMFTQNQFKNHIWRVIGRNCGKVVKVLLAVPQGEVVDVFNVMNRFTLDTIGSVGFARDIGALDNAQTPFLRSFDRAQQITALRFITPLWELMRWFGIGEEREARQHLKLLQDYSMETVQLLKADTEADKGDSFVGLFVKAAQKNGIEYDDNYLKDLVLNFLIAGRDTTAQSLSWIFWLVMCHPDVEARIVQEVEDTLGDEPVTYENSSKLTYVQNVIHEGLRLYPSVPLDSKIAIGDDTLPDGTFIPSGTVVQYSAYAMARSKDLWGEDAEAFKPERWEGRAPPSAFEYPVFNAGPRECLGKRLAWVEMRACIAAVLRDVRLELAVPRESIRQDFQLTIGMSSGLPCRVFPRR